MKKTVNIFAGVSSIAAAIVIYMTVMSVVEKETNILPNVIASVALVALTVSFICISALLDRTESLEHDVRMLLDDGYEQEDDPVKKECPFCHALIDPGEEICPYCENKGAGQMTHNEYFATEDPDYRGTDFSGEEYVSANIDNTEDK